MKLSNNELMEKWGFWLIVYAFLSIFSTAVLLSYPYDLTSHLIAAAILLPCLAGGILFLYFGAKFRSGIDLCAGVAMLLPVTFLGSPTYERRMVGLIFLVSFCLLVARCAKTYFAKDQTIEKWGNRLAGFVMCVPLLTSCLYLFARAAPGRPWEIFPSTELMWLAVPCVLGGLFYAFLGAKYRSYKYANMGLATIYLAYFNFAFVIGLAFSFMD